MPDGEEGFDYLDDELGGEPGVTGGGAENLVQEYQPPVKPEGEEPPPGEGPDLPPERAGEVKGGWEGGFPYWYRAALTKATPPGGLKWGDLPEAERYVLVWKRGRAAGRMATVRGIRGLYPQSPLGELLPGPSGQPEPYYVSPPTAAAKIPKPKKIPTYTRTVGDEVQEIEEGTGRIVSRTPLPQVPMTEEEINERARRSWRASAEWADWLQSQRQEAKAAEEARLAPGRARGQIASWLGGTARSPTQASFLNALIASGVDEASLPMWLRRVSPDWDLPGGPQAEIERARLAGVPVPGTTAPSVTIPPLGAPPELQHLAGMHVSATSPLWPRLQELNVAPRTPLGITEAKEKGEREQREAEQLTATRQPFLALARRRGTPFRQR